MDQNEIDQYGRSFRQAAGLPVLSATAVVRGFEMTNADRIIGVLVKRLGGRVTVSPDELRAVEGISVLRNSDGTTDLDAG